MLRIFLFLFCLIFYTKAAFVKNFFSFILQLLFWFFYAVVVMVTDAFHFVPLTQNKPASDQKYYIIS